MAAIKRKINDKLKKYVQDEFNTYYEVFFGGGTLLFGLSPREAVINDFESSVLKELD